MENIQFTATNESIEKLKKDLKIQEHNFALLVDALTQDGILCSTQGYISQPDFIESPTVLHGITLKEDRREVKSAVVLCMDYKFGKIEAMFRHENLSQRGNKSYGGDIDVALMKKEITKFLSECDTDFEGFIFQDIVPKAHKFTLGK